MKRSAYLAIFLFLSTALGAGDGRGLFKIGVTAPVLMRFVAPVYRSEAVATGNRTIHVQLVVEGDGRVSDILFGSDGQKLDGDMVNAVKKWTFAPALRNGTPVPVLMWCTFTFDTKTGEFTVSMEQ